MTKLILVFLLLTTGLKGIAQDNEIEEAIRLRCLEETFQSLGINLGEELDKLELYLIQTKQLKDSSGKSYFNHYIKTDKSNESFTVVPIKDFKNLQVKQYLKTFKSKCVSKFDTINNEFKVNQLRAYLASKKKSHDSINSSETIGSILSPEDFNRPYLRALLLLTIANTSYDETPNTLNEVLQINVDNSECTNIHIGFTSANEWLLSENELAEDELINFLEKKFTHNPKEFCLQITASRKSLYLPYKTFIDKVYLLYENYRKDISRRLWQKEYSQLTLSQRIQLEQSIPIRITSEVVD